MDGSDTTYTNAFSVAPMTQSIDLMPGTVFHGQIRVINPITASEDCHYHVDVSRYSVIGEDYRPDFWTESSYTMIKDWIEIENPDGLLEPNNTAIVNYSITVPETAPAGGQYAALVVSSGEGDFSNEQTSISSVYEIASIIYAKVQGETFRVGRVLENSIPSFVVATPVETTIKIQNDGNIHEIAQISTSIENAITGEVVFPKEDESGTVVEVVLPGGTRSYGRHVDDIFPLGVYEARQTVKYMGQTYEESSTMVLCPIWLIVLIVIIVVALVGFIISLILRHKRRI